MYLVFAGFVCGFVCERPIEHVDNRNVLDFIKEAHFYNQL